ncbi:MULTISPECIES: universal stress protein [Paenibacillus]|uniref:Universal stress protein n=1 Tax=Paenibacillus campinasensis TaxID=66347 RepID=A0A268EK45_9BACL|nr:MULTISPECIES: universal stress protein [Paenibacillus]MUG67346.1 universal stress protein [Paenibacillus campinasensis]PAD73454.1 universal stress protein UspA [Paenibacillus campinasensis]PAK51173.1 universal stress protein UspA [Paenibacillus sp. 7541]
MLFTKILLAYDGSEAASKALGRAIELAQASPDAVLDVVHAYDYPRFFIGEALAPIPATLNKDVYDIAVQTVEEAKKQVQHAGIHANVEMIQGGPAEVILEYAKQNGSDLIVVGSRGLGGIREFVLGSVSHNVVQHATIPVLVVK